MRTPEKMRLVVGLGNPGERFTNTRHNVGFIVLDDYLGDVEWRREQRAMTHRREETLFCKPMTFMNLSGDAVVKLKNFFRVANSDILVVYDDLYLAEGTFRFGINKNDGGHNGIKNIIERLGGRDFCTLRIGIGPRENADSIAEYVMENLGSRSRTKLRAIYPTLFAAIGDFEGGFDISRLQNKYNG